MKDKDQTGGRDVLPHECWKTGIFRNRKAAQDIIVDREKDSL